MDTLRLFLDVARYHSFSQAASEHLLTQSAVSQRIHALEKKLNIKLFDRSIRPLGLTPAGDIFLREVREIIDRYAHLEHRIASMNASLSGHIEIDAIYSAGIDLIHYVIKSFSATFPKVRVDVRYDRPDQIYDSVLQGRSDLGIVSYPQKWRGAGIIALREELMTLVCHPQHPLASRASVHPKDLNNWSMATFDASLPVGRHVRKYLRENASTPSITNEFDNIDTIRHAVLVTDQVAILPKRTVWRQLHKGELVAVDLKPHIYRPLGIIYHRRLTNGQQFSPAMQAFVDYLLQHAHAEPHLTLPMQTNAPELVGGKTI